MKLIKVMMVMLLLGSISIPVLGCDSEAESTSASENQVVTTERGDLVIDITAVGNLALSLTEDLAFDIFYPEATVEEVLVEEGDVVQKGQELAKLDISEWEEQLSVLEDKVTAAERQLTAKQRDLLQTEVNLKKADIALEEAEALYIWSTETFAARQAVWNAQSDVDEARATLRGERLIYDRNTGSEYYYEPKTSSDIEYWNQKLADAEEKLRIAQVALDQLLAASSGDTDEVTIKRLETELARGRVEDAHQAIEDAEKALEDAQHDLEEAKSKSPIVTAAFDGFITRVNVEGGDEVLNGTVAVQLADPTRFEADVLVGEMDILQVKLGGDANVQIDAMPSATFRAKVTHISPTATIQSGVVSYTVKIELASLTPLEPVAGGGQEQSQSGLESFYEKVDEAVEQGQITKEQADEMKEGIAKLDEAVEEGTITQEQADEIRQRLGITTETGQKPQGMIPEDFQLREGLTVTVSILVVERNGVLLVPNKAITHQEGETYVQVLTDGIAESRLIKTGISDWQNTEVTEGLNEGEQVVIGQAPTDTSTTPQQ